GRPPPPGRGGGGGGGGGAPPRRDGPTGPLAVAFDEMADRIQALIESRQELLNGVSHELRGPLQRLRFGVDLLEVEDDAAERARRVTDIQGDIDELDALVEELLAWSRLGAGAELSLTEVDAGALLAAVSEDAGRLRPEVIVAVRTDGPVVASLDRRLFTRAVANLVSNAVRYADGQVSVVVEDVGGCLQVRVDDDGSGVPSADRARVFEPFVRLDAARARDTGGVGLGLAISSRIAAAHGATLTVGDGELGGASFVWRGAAPQRTGGLQSLTEG
ncbi:MAG: signal transduction histidine kinase, partial [Myxococcota bacterium]